MPKNYSVVYGDRPDAHTSDSYRPLYLYLELQTPENVASITPLVAPAAQEQTDENEPAYSSVDRYHPVATTEEGRIAQFNQERRDAANRLSINSTELSVKQKNITDTLKVETEKPAAFSGVVALDNAQDAQVKGIAKELDTGMVYKSTVLPVDSHMMSLQIEETTESLVWTGELELYDPASTELVTSLFKSGDPFHGATRIVIRFGASSDPSESPLFTGDLTQVRTSLRPEGAMVHLKLVSSDLGRDALLKNENTPKLGIKETDTWSSIFKRIALAGKWKMIGFEEQDKSGKFSQKIGASASMKQGENLVEFAQSLCKEYYPVDPFGNRIYFKVVKTRAVGETEPRVHYFFGTEGYAQKLGLGRDQQTFIFGSPDSNVIEAEFDDNTYLAAMLGAGRALVQSTELKDSEKRLYAITGGVLRQVDNAADLKEMTKKLKDDKRLATYIPIKPGSSASATFNSLSAYVNYMKKAQMAATVTVPGNHSVLVFDKFNFHYLIQKNGEYTDSYLSGEYSANRVMHSIRGGQWTTTYDAYKYTGDKDYLENVIPSADTVIIQLEAGETLEEGVRRLFAAAVTDAEIKEYTEETAAYPTARVISNTAAVLGAVPLR